MYFMCINVLPKSLPVSSVCVCVQCSPRPEDIRVPGPGVTDPGELEWCMK